MHKWLTGAVLALGAVIGIFAQNTAPFDALAALELGNARTLAVTSDGEQLIVGTGDESQAHVYSLADLSSPRFLNAADLDGSPTAMIGALDYALVTVAADDAALLQIVARPSYDPRQGYINYGTYEGIVEQPTGMAISPSNRWGVMYGESGYTILEILSVDDINSRNVENISITSAAVIDSGILLLPTDRETLEFVALGRGAELGRTRQLELSAAGRDVSVNATGTVGAVLLDNNSLQLFAPVDLTELSSLPLSDAFDQVNFLTQEDGEWLILSQTGETELLLLDVSNPESIQPIGTFSLDAPLEILTVYQNLMVISDGQTVTLFTAE